MTKSSIEKINLANSVVRAKRIECIKKIMVQYNIKDRKGIQSMLSSDYGIDVSLKTVFRDVRYIRKQWIQERNEKIRHTKKINKAAKAESEKPPLPESEQKPCTACGKVITNDWFNRRLRNNKKTLSKSEQDWADGSDDFE